MTRVFVARMVGLPVLGPDGENIGRVRDAVSAVSVGPRPARVLGLIVGVGSRRRIFVPMLRVTAIDAGAVTLSTGQVNLRPFAQRPNEVLVVGEMLDAGVRVVDRAVDATVVDALMEHTRSRDWLITRLAVTERVGRLGRRGPVQVLPWAAVSGLSLAEEGQGTEQLLATFEDMRSADVAQALLDLPLRRRHDVADGLDDERLADVLEELPNVDQRDLLRHLDSERAADVLEAMDPDDAADLLADLPDPESEQLLGLMEPEDSQSVRRLLTYSADTAGGMMTPEPIVLNPDSTVAEALARVRNPDITPALASMVFVARPPSATPTGRYLGCVHAQRLLREAPFELVAGVLDAELTRLHPDASLTEVTRYFATYNLVCGPVIDENDHLLGAVTVDDVLDHLLPEDWRTQDPDPTTTGGLRVPPSALPPAGVDAATATAASPRSSASRRPAPARRTRGGRRA
jgi:CBS domain-containing protein